MTPHDLRLPVHLELVELLLTATGSALLARARMRGAVVRGIAHVSVRVGRFVAEVDFEEPIGPEQQDGLALMLTALPGSSPRAMCNHVDRARSAG